MKLFRAYKTELDPNNKQVTAFKKHCGAARFAYNWALADRIKTYEATGKSGSLYEQKRRFNALKRSEWGWLYEVSKHAPECAIHNLDRAYQNFFRRVKAGKKPGFPRFKSRKRGLGAFTMRGSIHVWPDSIQLPRIGRVRLKERNYLPGDDEVKILSANISERAGRWFVSLQVERDVPDPVPAAGPVLGIDLGLKSLAVCSDGTAFENPRSLVTAERRLKRLQRELSRRHKKGEGGSLGKNRAKSRRKLARQHYRVACIRQHALHQVSDYVTAKAKPSTVVLENLNISGMLQNRKLSKAIADASMGELRRQIEYKAKWNGIEVVLANTFYPSSKTCHGCGYVYTDLTLAEREWTCPCCGVVHDRDLNAALNLASLAEGQRSEPENIGGLPVELAGNRTPL